MFEQLVVMFGNLLKVVNLYDRGLTNAKNIIVNKVEAKFDNLPNSFEGYNILHLSDLHLDSISGIEDIICKKIEKLNYDLCVFTGNYRKHTHGGQICLPGKIPIITHVNDGRKFNKGLW